MRKRFRWGAVTGLLVLTAVALFRRWFRRQSPQVSPERVEYVIPHEAEDDEVSVLAKVRDQGVVAPREHTDDLTKIAGIGPKSAQVLAAVGILSFEQLAESSVEQLHQILKAAGLRIVHPDTWPEQAGFATVGDWTGLKALQATLDRGRRIKS